MIKNILFVPDSEFHLLDILVNCSMKRVCKLLKLFWKLPLGLDNSGPKNDRQFWIIFSGPKNDRQFWIILALKMTDKIQGGCCL